MSAGDRLALVSGTSSGVGAAAARLLVADGWTVVGMSRTDAGYSDPLYRHIRVDLGDVAGLREIVERELAAVVADARWRRIGLVNNAATVGLLMPLENADPAKVAEVLALNTVAPIFLTGFLIRVAPAATALRIVNVSSGAATQAFPGFGDYSASKAALRMAGMVFATELASAQRPGGARDDVEILSFSPGVVDTPMQQSARSPRPWNDMFVDFHERGQLVRPEAPAREIADFLAGNGGQRFVERRYGTP